MSLWIAGIGTAVPPQSLTQADALAEALRHFAETQEDKRWITSLYQNSGVQTRHIALLQSSAGGARERQELFAPTGEEGDRGPSTKQRMMRYESVAPQLALEACQGALADAGIKAWHISHLISVSCTGFSAPGFDVALVGKLGLLPSVERTHIGFMGCHGALNGLRVARAFLEAHTTNCVLICAVELCSLHYHYGADREKLIANALFADGAAALVATGNPRDGQPRWFASGNGSTVLSDSTDDMTWRIGDHGFEMTLSQRVPELIVRHLRPWLNRWLRGHGLSVDEVKSWAVHPGGPMILSAFLEATSVNPDAASFSSQVLADFGNMSSPTILFVLDRMRKADCPRPCVMMGFGPGLTVEACLVR